MSSKIKIVTAILGVILLGFTSCTQETYSLGDLSSPAELVINADVVGKTATMPNGDGSGVVNFTFTAKNAISYKVDFGNGSAQKLVSSVTSLKYNKVGTKHYRVIVTALGKGGATTTITKDVVVYYAYDVNPLTVTLLTGDSPTGKKWRVDKDAAGHVGLGPGPSRPDGNAETFTPSWWSAKPNEKVGKGIYDDVYTFTNTKMFTHQTNGDMYGIKSWFKEFDPTTPGVYGGYGDEWILTYPDYTEGFDYDGDPATASSPKREYINFENHGHCGFFMGGHKYMILDITATTMWLRVSFPGTNENAWYVKLIAI